MSDMISLDSIVLKIDEKYLKALKQDVQAYEKGEMELGDKIQDKMFKHLLDTLEAEDLENINIFYNNYREDLQLEWYTDYDNYAQAVAINLMTGELAQTPKDFNGVVFTVATWPNSIYRPYFKDASELIDGLTEVLYIPRNFKIEDNLLFLTGVEYAD